MSMNFVQIQPTEIHLKGISRTNTFYIHNNNPILAVAFQLEFSNELNSSSSMLSIFPQKGILLRGESQPIKVKLAAGGVDSTMDSFSEMISVRLRYKFDYNRQLMLRQNLKSWDQVPLQAQVRQVQVIIGRQKEAIEKYIKDDIMFNQEFDQNELNISAIQESKSKSFFNQASMDELQLESIIKDPLMLSQSGQMDINNINVHSPSHHPVIEQLCPLQYGQSRAAWFTKQQSNTSQVKLPFVESRLTKTQNKSFIEMKTVYNNQFSSDFTSRISQKRTIELVVLAILSAFFVSLGNNFGRILGLS